ncbi:helix-turn-helix domain-containing protein [Nocardioides speluncae]|uniref:helix-turn-helix domain-containing protein n=1 Tax=Nocardioides speluncae TaxID=2670337 RepID=UPI000D696CAF|nr:helix-turn-helix transcriptional regulator [Nocardioides speluncae]
MSESTLGGYIRARRDQTQPADVGLPPGLRRRAPGLRRAELAMLAGISVEYLVRLEQGRDHNPSGQVLGALADALRLTPEERVHLKRLSNVTSGECGYVARPPSHEVRPTVLALLEQLEPAPGVLLNRVSDVLAYTSGYELVAGPVGLLDGTPPNLLRFLFNDERAKTAFPDWDQVVLRHSQQLRLMQPDPHVDALIDELGLCEGEDLRDPLADARLPRTSGIERWQHPEAGELRLSFETLELPVGDEQRLVVHAAADDATAARLDGLVRRGGLRAVT